MIVLAGPPYGGGTGKGDVITMFPVIEAIAEETGCAYVAIQDAAVRDLLPLSERVHLIDDLPATMWRHHNVLRLDVHAGVAEFGKVEHPTQMFFRQAGMPVPAEVPRPNVRVVRNEGVPYDYVIAPFTNAQAERGWPLERWAEAVAQLPQHHKIGIVCEVKDYAEAVRIAPFPTHQIIIGDGALPVIAGIFVNARCVITVDSMANRLAHAVAARHVLLHGQDATPTAWAFDYDRAGLAVTLSCARMADISVDDVLREAQRMHG